MGYTLHLHCGNEMQVERGLVEKAVGDVCKRKLHPSLYSGTRPAYVECHSRKYLLLQCLKECRQHKGRRCRQTAALKSKTGLTCASFSSEISK